MAHSEVVAMTYTAVGYGGKYSVILVSCRKSSGSTFSGDSFSRQGVTKFRAVENSFSFGPCVAGMANYFMAMVIKLRTTDPCCTKFPSTQLTNRLKWAQQPQPE